MRILAYASVGIIAAGCTLTEGELKLAHVSRPPEPSSGVMVPAAECSQPGCQLSLGDAAFEPEPPSELGPRYEPEPPAEVAPLPSTGGGATANQGGADGGVCTGCPGSAPLDSGTPVPPSTCLDGAFNGAEADLDCGGSDPLCARCEPGKACGSDADCASGVCEAGRCCGGTGQDCARCAERLSPTLSCSSAPRGGTIHCTGFLLCLAANAAVCTTRFAAGCSNDPGGACNHNTYGGNGGLGLQHVTRILREAGCTP